MLFRSKTRYSKPFEQVEIKIPYETGMNPYSGLVNMFENMKLLVKDGNSLRYDFTDGTSIKQFRKDWEKNSNQSLDLAMTDFINKPIITVEKEQINDIETTIVEEETGE